MAWYSKVVWSEGLFLRPHHLQQHDRYVEGLIEARVRNVTPYPWGFTALEIDRDMAQQSKFALRRATGVMPDGTPFDMPANSPLPPPIDVPETAAKQVFWLTMPMATANSREVDEADTTDSASRYVSAAELMIDTTSSLRIEEEIDIGHPRLAFQLRKTPKPGFAALGIARALEVKDKLILFDDRYVPPLLACSAHPVVDGWIDRVSGWIENKLEELARFAADPSAGGGIQQADYFILQLLNRHSSVLKHFRRSRYIHPERLFEEFLRLVGDLSTFASRARRAGEYPMYDHDDLENVFAPVMRDLQDYLSARLGRRVQRLEIQQVNASAYRAKITDRSLFRNATFVLEVAAQRPITDIQLQFPQLFKVGPDTKMQEIVFQHLPGVGLNHMPTPPQQLRVMPDHVYFALDRFSPLWPEFSTAATIGMHFSGDWPNLELELWAILGDSR